MYFVRVSPLIKQQFLAANFQYHVTLRIFIGFIKSIDKQDMRGGVPKRRRLSLCFNSPCAKNVGIHIPDQDWQLVP